MPQIMAKASNCHAFDISLRNFQLRLCLLQLFCHFERQISSPNAMFKSLMSPSRKHIATHPKLKQIPQPLKLSSIYDLYQVLRQLNMAMHWIHIGCWIFLLRTLVTTKLWIDTLWALSFTCSGSWRKALRMSPRLVFKLAREMGRIRTDGSPWWWVHPFVLVLSTYRDCMIIFWVWVHDTV